MNLLAVETTKVLLLNEFGDFAQLKIYFRKILLLSFVLTLGSLANAQNSPYDCAYAKTVCSGDSIPINFSSPFGSVDELGNSTTSNPYSNPGSNGNSGCLLGGENYSHWIKINVATSGMLEFSLSSDSLGFRDWIMWEYDSTTCLNILAQTHPPVACNYNSVASTITGMASNSNLPSGGSIFNFEVPINVLAGEQYVICYNVNTTDEPSSYIHFNSFGSAQLCGIVNSNLCADPPVIVDSLSFQSSTCNNLCDGEISINASGQTDSILYTMDAITNYDGSFDNLCPGLYNIQVEDSIGCVQYATINISTPPLITPTISTDTVLLICDVFCDTITANGLQSYTWISNTISMGSQFTPCDTVPESIQLTGLDSDGCQSDTVIITFEKIEFGIDSIGIMANSDTISYGATAQICLTGDLSNLNVVWDDATTDSCIEINNQTGTITRCVIISDSCGRERELCYTVFFESNVELKKNFLTSFNIIEKPNGFYIDGLWEDKSCQVVLLDSQGRMVFYDAMYTGNNLINTENLSEGIYYLRVNNHTKKYFKPF